MNCSATCYMNSLLQLLFHDPEFKSGILRASDFHPANDEQNLPKDQTVFYQLQFLFASLSQSKSPYYPTGNFARAVKDSDGNAINVTQQMDVQEFFNFLFDRIEFALAGTQEVKTVEPEGTACL